jgi:IS30 family transposase
LALAYLSGQYSLAEIARHFGVHYSTVSRVVNRHEAASMRWYKT